MTGDERSWAKRRCCSWQIVLIGKYEVDSIIRVFSVFFDVVQYLGAKVYTSTLCSDTSNLATAGTSDSSVTQDSRFLSEIALSCILHHDKFFTF
jgi:hypothetical protein